MGPRDDVVPHALPGRLLQTLELLAGLGEGVVVVVVPRLPVLPGRSVTWVTTVIISRAPLEWQAGQLLGGYCEVLSSRAT